MRQEKIKETQTKKNPQKLQNQRTTQNATSILDDLSDRPGIFPPFLGKSAFNFICRVLKKT